MELYPPLPMTDEFMPAYLSGRGTQNRDEAFLLRDAQGMPDKNGIKRHGGVDIFAPGGHVIRAPATGVVRRSDFSLDRSGPVFGGVLVLEHRDGKASVMRHCDPTAGIGAVILAGQPCARVTDWMSGGDHFHYELWKGIPASNPWLNGYRIENGIDPASIEWAEKVEDAEQPELVMYHFENPSFDEGGSGPRELGPWRVWSEQQERDYQGQRSRGRIVSHHLFNGLHWMLEWPEGTYNNPYFFGYMVLNSRDNAQAIWEGRLGVKLRPFRGRANSSYRHKGGKK